jgi:hypothetical protein
MGTNTLKTDIVFPTTSDGSLSLFGNSSGSATSAGITIDSSGVVTTTGALDIGNATSDTVTVTARFDSDLLPSTDNARDLGSVTLEWKDLYIDGTAYLDTADIGTGTVSTLTASGSLNGNLNSDLISAETSGSDVLFGDSIDLQTNIIKTSATNQSITLTPSGTGGVVVSGATNPASVALNDEANTYSVTLTIPTSASLGASYTLTLPTSDGSVGQVMITDGSGNLSWSTVSGTGTVTSVAISGTDGIEVDSGSPITTSGTITLGVNAQTLVQTIETLTGDNRINVNALARDSADNGQALVYNSASGNWEPEDLTDFGATNGKVIALSLIFG